MLFNGKWHFQYMRPYYKQWAIGEWYDQCLHSVRGYTPIDEALSFQAFSKSDEGREFLRAHDDGEAKALYGELREVLHLVWFDHGGRKLIRPSVGLCHLFEKTDIDCPVNTVA